MIRAEITNYISAMVKDPSVMIVAIIGVVFMLGGIGIGFGMVFRSTPRYVTLIVLSFFNFILSILGKPQIYVPAEYDTKENIPGTDIFPRIVQARKATKGDRQNEDSQEKKVK